MSIDILDLPTRHHQLMEAIGYAALSDRRDEAVGAEGGIEPEWEPLFESISRHGTGVLGDWRNVANRISRERGLAYRPASIEEGAQDEGWALDPIPWVISPEKWNSLEAGLSQRMRLYSEILNDIYGEQRVLAHRWVPAEILLGHGGFVRALRDLPPGNGVVGIGLSAFDVAKDACGQRFVVNDRFDCPFGLGLALENRSVVNKVLPRLFRRCGVQRIGQFFIDWFDFLTRHGGERSDQPLVVVLDASGAEEDSEIGFLANYCGILRVHPSDLTVRGGRVWIKALRGLVPVDVIWKTTRGREMDSLEAESVSHSGVAGIFEAMRVGGVKVASHPGGEVLQSPGIYPFLAKLCRELLGEELIIPPVATWWCGQPAALSHVLAKLPSMVIKSVGHHRDFETQYGSRLSSDQLDALRARIEGNPGGFVGQEELHITTVPTSRSDRLVPRGSVLRVFGYLDDVSGPRFLPGGLARVSSATGLVVSTRGRGESKDVWIRSGEEQEPFSIASVVERSLPTAPDIVPSRTGENLFWTGRYAERAQVTARFAARIIDAQSRGFSHDAAFESRHENLLVRGLFEVFGATDRLKKMKEPWDRLGLILRDSSCPVGIAYHLERLRSTTNLTRESWSPASIRTIESCLGSWERALAQPRSHFGFAPYLDELQLNLSAFLGLNLDSMTRDEGWALLDAGRRVERALIICGLLKFLLKSRVEGDMSTLLNESILYILDSVRTYQRRYHDAPKTARTVQLLLGDLDYPRSVSQILERLKEVLLKLPVPVGGQQPPMKRLLAASEELGDFVKSMPGAAEEGDFQEDKARKLISGLRQSMAKLSDELTISYFSHAIEA